MIRGCAHEIEFGDRSRMRRHRVHRCARPFIFTGRIIVNFDREMRSRRPPAPLSSARRGTILRRFFVRTRRGRRRRREMRHGGAASRELRSRTVDSLIAPASRDYQESEGFLNCALSSGKPTRLRQLMPRRARSIPRRRRLASRINSEMTDEAPRCTLTPWGNKGEQKSHRIQY